MRSDQLEAYLGRIGVDAGAQPTLETLKQIQEQHIYAIAVENLDIIHGKLPLSLNIDDLVDKVVGRRRGGISFELNVLLADALRDLGYQVKLLSAMHPRYGNELDHACVLVDVPGDEGTWLVDVGFTEAFRTPLLFDGRIWQSDGRDAYTFAADPDDPKFWRLLRRRGGQVELMYSFQLVEQPIEKLAERCNWFCTNEKSRFTQGPFVFVERPEGRICLSMDTVTNTFTGEQIRPVIEDEQAGRAVLREIFGIEEEAAQGQPDDKFGYERIFAALGDDAKLDAVVDRAVGLALEKKAHLRFGHIVVEADREDRSTSFPAYVQEVRERLQARVAARLEQLGAGEELLGGEVVVMGSNSRIGATIDTPVDYAPEQLVESLIRPFNPDTVVCGSSGKSKLRSFFKGSTSDYLTRKLDCTIVKVDA